ncbi:6-bladed beta-propeller [Roseimarinus sediminis]|uniref:6-bladed beta-propeller n=1 Tax=Roseimarinus sediminis TaxID=1610899 RepID=UPI003D2093ED
MQRLLIISMLFFSLTLQAQVRVFIPEPYGDRFIESDLIEAVTMIPLELERYGMIAPEMEMKIDGDNFFILDNRFTQCVYRFDSSGVLLNTICEKKSTNASNNLPELNNPVKFNIDPYTQHVEIYNFENSTIKRFAYDGQEKAQLSLRISPSDFTRDEAGNYWLYTGWNNSESQFRLIKTDASGAITDKKMRLISKCTPTEGFSFYASKTALLFWELLGNTAYAIENDELTPRYLFDFGSHKLPLDYHMMPADESFIMINEAGYYTFKKYLENNNFAYFFLNYTSNMQREMFHVIHDKKSDKMNIYTENSGIGAFDKAQHLSSGNELYFLVSPRKIRQLLGGGSDYLPAPFTELAEKVGSLRNPVILKIKLKSANDAMQEQAIPDQSDTLYFQN